MAIHNVLTLFKAVRLDAIANFKSFGASGRQRLTKISILSLTFALQCNLMMNDDEMMMMMMMMMNDDEIAYFTVR